MLAIVKERLWLCFVLIFIYFFLSITQDLFTQTTRKSIFKESKVRVVAGDSQREMFIFVLFCFYLSFYFFQFIFVFDLFTQAVRKNI